MTTIQYDTSEIISSNGELDESKESQFVDNRVKIVISNPKKIKAWEVSVIQSGLFENIFLVFSRYLYQGDQLVSPNLPSKPLKKLSNKEREQIENSRAYEMLENFSLVEVKAAAQSFSNQATAGF